ncbi:MAG: glycosidase, partial [Candidatus Marinimicrobia bacterium]|nr:glycosidase [Candidatus Neomarinimicrobiota bacterium]
MKTAVVKRYAKNPILTKEQVPYRVETVHNAGVVKHQGKYVMLFRSHLQNGRSIIGLAESADGFSFSASKDPFLVPATEGPFAEDEEFGVEDLRICALQGEDYLLTYSAYSKHGVRIALARTADFRQIERVAMISQPDMRNVVIFPEKRNGRYV